MKNILGAISKVIGWMLFIGVFATIGLGNDKPVIAIVMYGVVITLLLGVFLMYQVTHKRRSFEIRKKNPSIYLLLGGVILFLGVISPVYFFESFRPGMLISLFSSGGNTISSLIPYSIITTITLIVMVAAFFIIRFINRNVHKAVYYRLIGYILLLILSALPGLSIMSKDSSYGSLGLIYYMTIFTAVLGWTGASLFGTGLNLRKKQ